MATYFEIPTISGRPFTERVVINNVEYTLRFKWNTRSLCWILEIWDSGNLNKILCGIPIVTGCDLLEQFIYLPIGARAELIVITIGPALSPDTIPTFTNLGGDGHLYLVTPP